MLRRCCWCLCSEDGGDNGGKDNEDGNDEDPNSKDSNDHIFDTTTNLWSDAFLAERGGDFNNDDNSNNNIRERG